jgi:hypothetical protein
MINHWPVPPRYVRFYPSRVWVTNEHQINEALPQIKMRHWTARPHNYPVTTTHWDWRFWCENATGDLAQDQVALALKPCRVR